MWKWLRSTRLFTQLEQISADHRSLRLAQHRYSLRIKRAAVRSRILHEIQKKHMQEAGIQMANAKLIARYEATRRILEEYEKRDEKLGALLKQRGINVPEKKRPQPTNEAEGGFRNKLFKNVENIVDDDGGIVGKNMARDALKESFGKVPARGSETDMAAALVAGLAKEIGLSREELRGLVETVERDGGDVGLRSAVMEALDKKSSSSQ